MNIYDGMSDGDWLALQARLSVKDFVGIASKLVMDQGDWTEFWNIIRVTKLSGSLDE
jgi:hypothetical protein